MKVIGLTGTMGSGKNTVMQMLLKKYTAYHVTLSNVIRGEIEKKRGGGLNRTSLQDMGDGIRKKYGGHILALVAVEYLPRDKQMIIVDGIRHPEEVMWLKKKFGSDFHMIAVDAPVEARFERVQKRMNKKDPKTLEEFKIADARDKGEGQPPYGQHVADCVAISDFTVQNAGTQKELQNQVAEVMQQII